jgi:hypothetical protein
MASSEDEVARYVAERAPELDPQEVRRFMSEHPRPDDVKESHLAWAVAVLRQRGEGEVGRGLPVDRVADELRRRGR